MYYQTKIRKVYSGGGAVDFQGKKLSFMGNLPVQAGDIVWTDGNVIFGHANIGDTPIIPIMISGIPVSGYGEFRGYIDKTGNFKKYATSADSWIVNTDKIFKHGEEKFNNEKIIDAEIAENGDLYLITEGFYRKNTLVTYNHKLFVHKVRGPEGALELANVDEGENPYFVTNKFYSYSGQTLKLGVDQNYSYGYLLKEPICKDKDIDLKIYKNYKQIASFNLKQIADIVTDKCFSIRDQMMTQSSQEGINLRQGEPPDDFIASVYARIITSYIDKNGNWDIIVSASAWGYCFPYMSFDVSIFSGTFPNDEDKFFNEMLVECIEKYFEIEFFKQNSFLNIEKYPQFTGTKKVNGSYTAEFQQYILDKCAYYIPLAKFKQKIWYPNIFNASILVKIHNGQVVDTIQSYSGGGREKIYLDYSTWDEKRIPKRGKYYDSIVIPAEEIRKEWSFPLGDGYYFVADGMKIKAIYNSEDKKIATIPNDIGLYDDYAEAYLCFPIQSAFEENAEYHYIVDSTAKGLAQRLNLEEKNILARFIYYFEGYIQDQYRNITYPLYYKIINKDGSYIDSNYYPMDVNLQLNFQNGWFTNPKKKEWALNDETFYLLKHVFTLLSNGACLLGLHGDKLYKINGDGTYENLLDRPDKSFQTADLKNFRLRELKNMAKAKKQSH